MIMTENITVGTYKHLIMQIIGKKSSIVKIVITIDIMKNLVT